MMFLFYLISFDNKIVKIIKKEFTEVFSIFDHAVSICSDQQKKKKVLNTELITKFLKKITPTKIKIFLIIFEIFKVKKYRKNTLIVLGNFL